VFTHRGPCIIRDLSLRKNEGRQVFDFVEALQAGISDLGLTEVERRQVSELFQQVQVFVAKGATARKTEGRYWMTGQLVGSLDLSAESFNLGDCLQLVLWRRDRGMEPLQQATPEFVLHYDPCGIQISVLTR